MAGDRETLRAAKTVLVQVASIAVAGKEGKALNLSLLGSIADQLHESASQGTQLQVVFSGDVEPSKKMAAAMAALLALKEPAVSIPISQVDLSGEVALQAATSAGANAVLYLSHAPGVPAPGQDKSGPLPTYLPPPSGTGSSCQPGAAVISSAWAAAQAGVPVVLAAAKEPGVIARLLAGEQLGTLFDVAAASAASAASTPVVSASQPPSCRDMAVRARRASRVLQALPSSARVAMLWRVADALVAAQDVILEENAKDVAEAQGHITDSLLQRLILKPDKIKQLAEGIRSIARQEEPIGQLIKRMEISPGLVLEKATAPIGVLLIIYEARPDALPQIAALAIRSGNGLLLKGGKEAMRSNAVLHRVIVEAVGPELGPDLISLVTTREEINDLLRLDDVIDLVIPRGGNALVSYIQRNTRIPVLGHADGVCHIYVDKAANLDMACQIVVDAKIDYPAACNAVEKVLVHSSWLTQPGEGADSGVQRVRAALEAAGVTVHGGERACAVLGLPAAPSQRHEYSSLDITLEIVDDQHQAIDHIHAHGSGHTEAIITDDTAAAASFLANVDAACVFHNASTRFSDGFRFGLGAEVGISTSRIHARGPVGVEGLMTTKWVLRGQGQVVAKDKGVNYTHKPLPFN